MSFPPQHIPAPGYGYPMVPPPAVPVGQPPLMPVPMMPPTGIMMPPPAQTAQTALMPTPLTPPEPNPTDQFAPVHVPISTSTMKVATTVFVGNISDKATDTLIRQMLLRCGPIVGWKRVQDASGKLQAFGFCEYASPDSTLRALRLLHDRKLGDKPLVVKVDAKTRKDLLKYVTKMKREKENEPADEFTIDRLVSEMEAKSDNGLSSLTEVLDDDMKTKDEEIDQIVTSLLKQHLEVLTSAKSTEDIQREHDVKESILFMAKQCGTLDPESTLEDVEMEDGMKTLVSDEIKRFRQAYKPSESRIMERKRLDDKPVRERDWDREERGHGSSPSRDRGRSSRTERSRSPRPRSRSPRRRSRTPPRSRSQERAERERRRASEREREREDTARDEEDYEERMRQRKQHARDRAYKEHLSTWESRERRKAKEYDRELANEESKRAEMQRERKHLADFLEEYDDAKDDHKYYRGSALSRRRREREVEMQEDKRDRLREKKEIESLRLQAIERQARSVLKDSYHGDSEGDSPSRSGQSEDDDEDTPPMEVSEDIPLTKTETPYPPIQVQSAPIVKTPPRKEEPKEPGMMVAASFKEEMIKNKDSPAGSPQVSKFTIGLKKSSNPQQSQTSTKKMEDIFSTETDEVEQKPKKKLVPIDYSDEEDGGKNGDSKERRISSEERKKMVQSLVNSIPSAKEAVFKYTLRWEQMDAGLIEKRVKPWINKKITEYIGETEPILTEFICNKLSCHIPPADILSDIAMVLDDEAEMFVVKLWRLLIYETEAKHLGIAKSY